MHVLYDHQAFVLQKHGGVSRVFCELINSLADIHTEELKLSVFMGYHINSSIIDSKKLFRYFSFKRKEIKRTNRIFNRLNKLPLWVFTKTLPPIDIYHSTYYSPSNIGSSKTKLVVTVFDMIHELFPEKFPKHDFTAAEKKKSIARADAIIAISENTKQDLIRLYGIDPAKIFVTYLASSLPNESLEPTHQKKPYLLFVGARDRYKNFLFFLESFRLSELYKTHNIICFGGGPLSAAEQNSIETLELKGQVIQLSGSDNLLVSLYKSATALIYPSLYEGFGLPVVEAMQLGCPVIASNTSSVPEVLGNGGWAFDPHNMGQLIEKINQLQSVESRNMLKNQGLLRATHFSWKNCALDTLRVYHSLNHP